MIVDEKGKKYRRVIKRGTSVKAKKVAEVYQLAHAAWRAGLVETFYYGQAAADDLRTVWRLEAPDIGLWEREDSTDTRKNALALLTDSLREAQIVALEFGPSWCGYRSLTVTYADGRKVTERWDGCRVVIEESVAS